MRAKKYTIVEDNLKQAIESRKLKPGQLIPSQNKLAEKFNLSRGCVQKAIEALFKEGLIDKHPGKGMFVREDKSLEESTSLERIIYLNRKSERMKPNSSDNFGLEMLLGAEEKSSEYDISFTYRSCFSSDNMDWLAKQIEAKQIDGIILDRNFDDKLVNRIKQFQIPCVILGRASRIKNIASVAPNFYDGIYELLNNLKSSGVKDVAFYYAGSHYYAEEFLAPIDLYSNRHPEMKITKIDYFNGVYYGANIEEELLGKSLLIQIESGKLPEVCVFSCDWNASRAIKMFLENGITIPGDVKVVGLYDLMLARSCKVPLTTLKITSYDIGRKAVELLYNRVMQGKKNMIERIPFSIIERDSCKIHINENDI